MKNIMVMGAAIEQLPGIIAAKEMGYHVGVIDYNPNAIGVPFADEYFNVSTIDEDGVCEAGKVFGADGFLTLATDMPIRAVAKACEKLGLPGISYETAIKATDKGKMIETFKAHNIESPWYYIIHSRNELEKLYKDITYPCIIKPIDNAASRGVIFVNSEKEMNAAYNYSIEHSRLKSLIVEEYMKGVEVSVETLTYEGETYVLQVTDKATTGAPHFVETGHNQPSLLPPQTLVSVKDLAIRAVNALGIMIGPAHVEIMVTENGPKLIELGARLGGDCITSHLVRLSTGIDMLQETIKTLCGERPDLTPKYSKCATIRFVMPEKTGIFRGIEGIEQALSIPEIKEINYILNRGEFVSGIQSSDDRLAYVIAQSDTMNNAIDSCMSAISKMTIKIESEDNHKTI